MEIKACLFDLDGVIVDTARYHYIAWRKIATELGFEFTLEHNERLKGVSRMQSLDILLEVGGISLSEKKKEELAKRKNEMYVSYILNMNHNEIFPGVIDFFNELRNKNIKIALGSASKNAGLILDRLKIKEHFDAIIDGTVAKKAKPDPEVFLKGANAVGVHPTQCIVFEDAYAGIEAAINGGMIPVGVGNASVLTNTATVIPGFEKMTLEKLYDLIRVTTT